MKKTTLITTALAIAALLIGCGDSGGDGNSTDEHQNPSAITEEFQTFYVKVLDQNRTGAPDISTGARWHFHNNVNNGDAIGFALQKLFVNDSPSETGAIVLYDFTDAEDFTSANKGAFDAGSMGAGEVTDGAWVVERTDAAYQYLGNLASSAEANGKAYWGFVVKNVSATARADNVNLGLLDANNTQVALSSLAGWFGIETFGAYTEESPAPNPDPTTPLLTADFATYYLDISGIPSFTGFRIKNASGSAAGIVIDEIFASEDTSETGKVVAFDFEETEGGTNWWGFTTGTKADGAWSSGEQPTDSGDIAAFGSGVFNGKQYLGIKAKNLSESVGGDALTIAPIANDAEVAAFTKTFAELFNE